MKGRFALGLDFGGSGLRASLLDLEQRRVTAVSRPFASAPDPGAPGGYRFDPRAAWQAVCAAAAEARTRAGATPDAIGAVAATSMRHGSVLLAADGAVLLATPNRDARGFAPASEWGWAHGEALQQRTGHWPQSVHPASRLRGVAIQDPALFARIATHLAISDWLAFEASGERATDPTQAGETLVFELSSRDFADDLIAQLSLSRALFPRVLEPGTALGPVRAQAARELGVAPGAVVSVGGADTQCGLIGAGALALGSWCLVAGSTAPLQVVIAEPRVHPRLWTSHAPVAARYVLESNAGGVGESLDWMASALYAESPSPLLALFHDAARALPGAGGVLSSAAGHVMDARALALPLGHITVTPIAGADGPARRAMLARAVVEGACFTLRANAEQIAGALGAGPPRCVVTGGLARSAAFTQILADTLGCEIDVPAEPGASAFGAALCAAVGAGAFPDLESAARACVQPARRHVPGARAREAATASFEAWSKVHEIMQPARGPATGHALRQAAAHGPAAATVAAARPRVLVASDMDEASLESLREIADVEYASFRKAARLLRGDALVKALAGVQVFVTEIDVVEASALVRCDDLRVIAVCRGDAVNVDVTACSALGIPVVHTPGRNADAVADLTLAFLLMLARKLPEATAYLREPGGKAGDLGRMGRAFATLQGRELWRRTVGLVGLGAVGRKVLARLRGFEARVFAYDPVLPPDAIRLAGAEPVSFAELLAWSEFVSLHAAVTEASRGLIGNEALAAMRPGACLINTARAALVDEAALAEALRSGRLGGAALDVFAVEPPGSDHPLLALPNVIATPHVGGNTQDVAAHQGQIVFEELTRLLAGEAPHHCLNPQTLAGFSFAAARPAPPPDLLERLGKGPGPAITDLARDAAAKEVKR
ncbi:MAG TPA: NAD(P)-dependent oxidoreductase [Myxococcota bacterium]|nr:NAD(P)-dependent oxidoreductase [Myxococcota bacterium]